MMTQETFRLAVAMMLGMSTDTEVGEHPSGDLTVKLVDGETFRIRVMDWDGKSPEEMCTCSAPNVAPSWRCKVHGFIEYRD